jgi:Holliday junction resolvase RusA-like endonuclease
MRIEFFHECILPTATAQGQGYRRYKSGKKKYAEAFFLAIMEQHKPARPLTGALKSCITLTYPLTKQQIKKGLTLVPKDTRPDYDNAAKIINDAINKAGLWEDDCKVADGRIVKYYGIVTGIAVTIEEL